MVRLGIHVKLALQNNHQNFDDYFAMLAFVAGADSNCKIMSNKSDKISNKLFTVCFFE